MTWQDRERMRFFMSVAEQPLTESVTHEENEKVEVPAMPDREIFLREIDDAISKIDAYYQEGSDDYQSGLIDGLNYAIAVLNLTKRTLEEENGIE